MVVSYGTELGPVDLNSDVTPHVEASSSQERYYVSSAWHLVSLWVRLTVNQMYTPVAVSSGQE